MASFYRMLLAAAGSVGNLTPPSVSLQGVCDKLALVFIVEAIGATPTVTFKFQGTLDPAEVTDANAQWTDLAVLPANSETVTAAPAAVTVVGASVFYLAQAQVRFLRRVRVVTSANTNVTYRTEAHAQIGV